MHVLGGAIQTSPFFHVTVHDFTDSNAGVMCWGMLKCVSPAMLTKVFFL